MTPNEPGWTGRKLGGRYEIEEILGRGGMSSVFRAVDPNLKRNVAVKIIHPHLTDNAEFIQRFELEAAAVAQLRHNNIVQVHDFNNDDGVYYMVMEYIAGETLAQKLKSIKSANLQLPVKDTISILAKVCDAVNYAHERRMIHRDLKPANVMINLLGEPILMDFGIAKIIGGQSHTATGAAMGTASYMSPEQVRGDKIDHRTDIYSLGIMLYEMLSGETPYHGDSTFQIMLKHVNEPIPDIRQFDINTPVTLIAILERALAKEVENRYQSAKEMGIALSTVGVQLHGSVTDTLAARYLDRLAILWQQATDFFERHRYDDCIEKLDELKQIDPNFQRIKIDELRQSAVDRLYERAARRYQEGNYQESRMILQALRQLAPDEPDLDQLARKIQHGLENQALLTKLDSLYEEATTLVDSRAFSQALSKWESIQRQRGDIAYADHLEVEKRANQGICDNTYNQAVAALSNDKPDEALRLWQEITAVLPTYEDSQQLVTTAASMIAEKQRRQKFSLLGAAGGLILIGIIAFFLIRGLGDGEETPGVATESSPAAVVADTGTATATMTVLPTETAVPITTPSPTGIPTHPATETPSPQPSATPSPLPTSAPTETATAMPAIVTAVAINNATIFTEPNSGADQLGFIGVDDIVIVLGRTSNASWLQIQTEDDKEGYVDATRFELATGTISDLLIITPQAFSGSTPVPDSGSFTQLILSNIYPLDGTGRCDGDNWSVKLYTEAQGGNGVYTYYADGGLVGENQPSGYSFNVSGTGNHIIVKIRVESGDGQSIVQDFFVPKPDCS